MRPGRFPNGDPAQGALPWSSRLGTKDPMAPSSRHLYPQWLRPGSARDAARRGATPDRQLDGAWRVWERLRAFDRRYATYVDVVLAVVLFVLCSGWFIDAGGTRPDLWLVAALIVPAGLPAPGAHGRLPRHRGGRVRPVARDRAGAGRRGAPRRHLHRRRSSRTGCWSSRRRSSSRPASSWPRCAGRRRATTSSPSSS